MGWIITMLVSYGVMLAAAVLLCFYTSFWPIAIAFVAAIVFAVSYIRSA